jgi:hypothetical protein
MRTIAKGWVATCSLPRFTADVVEVQLEKGMASGRFGWDNPDLCTDKELLRLHTAAIARKDYMAATCYSAMLAAREHNLGEQP